MTNMKTVRSIALILTLVLTLLCAVVIPAASAESSYYQEQLQKFENMKNRTISIDIDNFGGYLRDKEKFYARKVTGVREDGSFILGSWECFNDPDDLFTLPGTYVHFGYSVDIVWGTDFPFSGPFWTDTNIPVNSIKIRLYGLCRVVQLKISVNGELVVIDDNCDPHSEWRL